MYIFRQNKEKSQVVQEPQESERNAAPQRVNKPIKPKPYKSDLQVALEVQKKLSFLEREVKAVLAHAYAAVKGQGNVKIQGDEDCDMICCEINNLRERIEELERENHALRLQTNCNTQSEK